MPTEMTPAQHRRYVEEASLGFALMVESLAAWRFKRERKAQRAYHCRFCEKSIPAGSQYLAHSDQAAHVHCVEKFQAILSEREGK